VLDALLLLATADFLELVVMIADCALSSSVGD